MAQPPVRLVPAERVFEEKRFLCEEGPAELFDARIELI
jgi:hypothetical protein